MLCGAFLLAEVNREQVQVLEHGLRQVDAVVLAEVLDQLVPNYRVLTEVVEVNIELISLLGHGCEDNGLANLMDIMNLALLALSRSLSLPRKKFAAVNSTFDQLLIHVDLLGILLVLRVILKFRLDLILAGL